jgi:N-acetylglucosamine repressor
MAESRVPWARGFEIKNDPNDALVLELIHSLKTITRPALGKLTHMSPSSVSKIVRRLINQGLIKELEMAPSTGGRPAARLVILPEAKAAIGAEWSDGRIHVVITDLYAGVQRSFAAPAPANIPDAITSQMVEMIRAAIEEAGPERVVGVGVAAPGVVNPDTGMMEFFTELDLRNYPVGQKIEAATGFTPVVHNRAMAAGMGEIWQGSGGGAQSLAYLSLGQSIGGGLILRGEPHQGVGVAAGEIGHITVVPDGDLCFCGNRGCLQTVASGGALASHIRERLKRGQSSSLLHTVDGHLELIDAVMILKAAASGDLLATEIISWAADYVGIAAGNLINVVSPEVFVLGGPLIDTCPEPWKQMIEGAIHRHSLTWSARGTRIVLSRLGEDSRAIGAAALAVRGWLRSQAPFYPRKVDDLLRRGWEAPDGGAVRERRPAAS